MKYNTNQCWAESQRDIVLLTCARPCGPKMTSATSPTSTASGAPTPKNDACICGAARRKTISRPCYASACSAERLRSLSTIGHESGRTKRTPAVRCSAVAAGLACLQRHDMYVRPRFVQQQSQFSVQMHVQLTKLCRAHPDARQACCPCTRCVGTAMPLVASLSG